MALAWIDNITLANTNGVPAFTLPGGDHCAMLSVGWFVVNVT